MPEVRGLRSHLRSESDLERITRQLKLTGRKDFSLCLYGPPGTGKSAYVRHLAETLDLPVVMKRASDLFDAYVGQTEKSIAKAFQEALDKGAFLVFDEADSLLGDRRYAVRNWEVSQVNEMLTWMENHPLPFACTTNLMDRLDQASLRRFTFKCHFDYLGEEQLGLAFERFFGMSATVGQLEGLIGLTPGDFALVDKKARIIGCEEDQNLLIDLLKQELAAKEHRPGRQMGFSRD
ncbi:ATP-binding protein [Geoalkalibacter halelectricus]|uniref:ATP-binding protein n=1 Tax=Geoalkalibacter halelectricus TaxID=2847045 RepID=UPI00266F4096|nr:ATP-binding protein [Geoalkalibacter halelectricus]MDO3377174.1 ATP-binding protein [Geoalkalibacter halelectricus]